MILAILNFYAATMSPSKFQLNETYGSGGDVKNMESQRRADDGQQDMA